jgi:hypothetical protein
VLVLLDLLTVRSMWLLLIGELLGGVVAGVTFNLLNLADDKPTTATYTEQAELAPQAEPSV